MNILGISAFYHDSAAALVRDGEIIAAAQEERFTRKKHDPEFPENAIDYCLKEAGISAAQIDHVVFYDKPFLKFERILETYLHYAPYGFQSFIKALPLWMKKKLWIKSLIQNSLPAYKGEVLFSEHHRSHAASAFYPSPFNEAAIITVDGVGEWTTTSLGLGKGNSIDILREIHFPHSLGMLYSAFTYYTGFRVNSGEYKLMGLAPYGEPKYVQMILDNLIDIREDGSFRLNMRYFNYAAGLTMTNRAFSRLFGGQPLKSGDTPGQREMDLARSVQEVIEQVMLKMAKQVRNLTGAKYLCLAGGVALNCVANGKLLREGSFEDLWIQPAAGDAGGALGAALAVWHEYLEQPRHITGTSDRQNGSYLGPKFDDHEIESFLTGYGIPFEDYSGKSTERQSDKEIQAQRPHLRQASTKVEDPPMAGTEAQSRGEAELHPATKRQDNQVGPWRAMAGDSESVIRLDIITKTAGLLADEKVVGWFQGRMEFGPRALGARSILGDPRSPQMQRELNLKIKYRESFRPFAPAVAVEDSGNYFEIDRPSPYMLLVADVAKPLRFFPSVNQQNLTGLDKLYVRRSELPAVTHVDYSARLQTVDKHTNEKFWQLLQAFKALSGYPVLINTSFNVRGEPIVATPLDAYKCFMRTEMDYLVLGNFLLDKKHQPQKIAGIEWEETFAPD